MGRFQAAVQAIESRSVAHFQKMAQTVHGLAEKLPQIRSGISIRPSLAAQFDQLRDPGFRSLLVSNDQNLPRYLAECHGQNGQNVFGVVTHLRDTLWTLEVVKAVLRADGASKPPATQRQTASTMVRTLFELEKPVLKMVHWVQSTPRHRALDWQTAILLDDIAELVRLVWDFGGNTTPGMVKARDRWLTALNSVATSCVCTIS
jgi:hypothetical protein